MTHDAIKSKYLMNAVTNSGGLVFWISIMIHELEAI